MVFLLVALVAPALASPTIPPPALPTGGAPVPILDEPPGAEPEPPEPPDPCPPQATLREGRVEPPACAPRAIRRAIRAANRIRRKPYVWGGGHSLAPDDSGYDCSGSVSYALVRARLLKIPRTSGGLANWRRPGRGRWLTVYASAQHAYAVIAGIRFDTSSYGAGGGSGPRWRSTQRPSAGFAARHAYGL